jgi:hypothetical protein
VSPRASGQGQRLKTNIALYEEADDAQTQGWKSGRGSNAVWDDECIKASRLLCGGNKGVGKCTAVNSRSARVQWNRRSSSGHAANVAL